LVFITDGNATIGPKFISGFLESKNSKELRVGDYRVIMDIDNNKFTILVLNAGHRKNIYQKVI